jgi:hypothetical protein
VLYGSEAGAKEVLREMRKRGGTVSGFDCLVRAKDGSTIPVLISASMLHDEEGREVGTVLDPGDELQQARLAGAVAADQTDAGFRRQRGAGAIENDVAAKTQCDAVDGEHGRGPYSDAVVCAQTIFSPSFRRFSADVNAATRKPDRLREKNKIGRDAFTPRPRANDQEGDTQ